MTQIAIAIAQNNLAKYLIQEANQRGFQVKNLVQSQHPAGGHKQIKKASKKEGVVSDDLTSRSLKGAAILIVDHQDLKLIKSVRKADVKKIVYVTRIVERAPGSAKLIPDFKTLTSKLETAGIAFQIIYHSAIFSDLERYPQMASTGRVFIFGKGSARSNPVHEEDLALFILDNLYSGQRELSAGGPDVLSEIEIAALALLASNQPKRITHLPAFLGKIPIVRRAIIGSDANSGFQGMSTTRLVNSQVAPRIGVRRLKNYFLAMADEISEEKIHR